eukprot:963474_1
MMQILASLLVLISITQSIIITEHDLGTQSYDQSVAACEAVGQTLASKDEVLDYLGGALGDDVWTPVYVSAGSFNDWLQIGGGTWPYGVLHTEIENGLKPSWGTEATTEYVFKKKFYCSNTIRPAITDPRECLTTQTNMVAWYNSDSIDILNNKWTDKIGGQDGNIIAATGIAVFDGADDQNELYLNGQTIVSGTSATRIDFGNTPFMVPDHTVFNLCKYRDNAAKRGRILDAKLFNGLYGFWWGKSGMAHETGWITQDTQSEFGDNWVLSSQRLDLYRGNGIVLSLPGKIGSALASNLDINNGQAIPDEESDWACGEIIVVNEKLSDNEIQCVEDYFSCKYDLGLTAHCGPQTLLAAENVCFNAKKKLYDYTFNPPANGIISGIKLVHTSGDVRCSQLDTLGTAFGCGNGWGAPNGALLVEMIEEIPGEKKTYYPATGTDGFNLRAGLQCTNGGGCSIGHYDLAGYTGEATEIQFNNPTYEVTKSQEFSIQYGEGCCEESTADNKGESCAKVYFIYDETYLGCPNKPDSFDWDSLTADGTNIPELYTAEDDIFSIPDGTLSLNVKIELEYEGAATGDTGDGPFGVTYVLDFEDFNAYSDHIYEPGTCQNREGNDFYAGTNLRPFNEWWEYSDDPNLPGHIGSQTTMAYPPQTNTFWTQTMSSNDDCGIIVYEGTFTWNDLVACAKTPGTKSYVKTTDGPTDISLSGKIGFYQSIDYKDVDGIPDGEGDHLFQVGKDNIYVEIDTDFASGNTNVFDTKLTNVWICTFAPGYAVDYNFDAALHTGGCWDANRDGCENVDQSTCDAEGFENPYFYHIYQGQAQPTPISLEDFNEINTDTESKLLRFYFTLPHRIARDTLYVQAQVEVTLQSGGTPRRVLLFGTKGGTAHKETNKMDHFIKGTGLTHDNYSPKNNPQPPQQPQEPINYPQPQPQAPLPNPNPNGFIVNLSSPWII